MPLFFMALIIDGVEFNMRWSEDQAVNPKASQDKGKAGKENDASMPDFASMKKAELVEYISPDGNDLDTTLTKAELVKIAEAMHTTKS